MIYKTWKPSQVRPHYTILEINSHKNHMQAISKHRMIAPNYSKVQLRQPVYTSVATGVSRVNIRLLDDTKRRAGGLGGLEGRVPN